MGITRSEHDLVEDSHESIADRSRDVLIATEWLPIGEQLEALPNLSLWNNFTDEQKMSTMKTMSTNDVYILMAGYGDHRTKPKSSDSIRTPYGNMIPPWMGLYRRVFGKERFNLGMAQGKLDSMVKELRSRSGAMKPGLDLESEWISLAASTGSTQNLWQYNESLLIMELIQEKIAAGNSWNEIKSDLNTLISEQNQRLKRAFGLPADGVIVRSQSGSESPLLDGLFGSKATWMMDEAGTSTWAASSARHTTPEGWMGHRHALDPITGLMPELAGLEEVRDASESKVRTTEGKYRNSQDLKNDAERWIVENRASDTDCRLTLTVVMGGKTGLGHNVGALSIEDAVSLRSKYGEGILITVDAAQARLETREIEKLVKLGVRIDFTGSKYLEGPMFSEFSYIPPEYADFAKETVDKSGLKILSGLSEYFTQSDLIELLDAERVAPLPDFPDIISLLKCDSIPRSQAAPFYLP